MDLGLALSAIGLLFIILIALGGVVAFMWNQYVKIMAEISKNAENIGRRIDKFLKETSDLDKRVALLEKDD